MALISVVVPNFNHRRFLAEALESLEAQTAKELELILVDDGSTDGSADVMAPWVEKGAVLVRLSTNVGLPRALNVGFSLATGEFWAWASADNRMHEDCYEALRCALEEQPEAGLAYADYRHFGRREAPVRLPQFDRARLLSANYIGPCFLYRRELALAAGPYDPACVGAEDWDMWLRMAALTDFVHVPRVLCDYRVHDDTLSARIPRRVRLSSRLAVRKARRLRAYRRALRDLVARRAGARK